MVLVSVISIWESPCYSLIDSVTSSPRASPLMELSSSPWLSDLEMDDSSFIHQSEMSTVDPFASQQVAAALDDDFQKSLSSESYTPYPTFGPPKRTAAATFTCASMAAADERPPNLFSKTGSWNAHKVAQAPTAAADGPFPRILSFGRPDEADDTRHFLRSFTGAPVKPEGEARRFLLSSMAGDQRVNSTDTMKMGTRPPSHAQDHIIAERKRREKISQRFIALSATVPGLKKMDKASVLGDAIKYVKQLQERVKTLEEQATKRTVETVVLVKKSQLPTDDDASSSVENLDAPPPGENLQPEVEAKVSDRSVLVRIHCEKRKGLLVKVLAEVEKLHLTVVNTSVVPFAGSALDITVMAQMDEGFSMTVRDLVKHLNLACRELM